MQVESTEIENCFLLKPKLIADKRGFFMESYNARKFKELTNLDIQFVQDNMSRSQYGVIRGLHAQKGTYAQAKLVSVLEGEVLDVVVDLRANSTSYGKTLEFVLNETNKHQLFVPRGCFHGFAVLSEQVTFYYKCDNYYNKEADYGIRYNDPSLGIDWQIPANKRLLSEKDLNLPILADLNI